MRAAKYLRMRGRIIRESRDRHAAMRRALDHLNRQAGAVPVTAGGAIVGHRLPSGETVCVKRRYTTAGAADADMLRMHQDHGTDGKPVRSYECPHCLGHHLTSAAFLD